MLKPVAELGPIGLGALLDFALRHCLLLLSGAGYGFEGVLDFELIVLQDYSWEGELPFIASCGEVGVRTGILHRSCRAM